MVIFKISFKNLRENEFDRITDIFYYLYFFQLTAIAPKFSTQSFTIRYPDGANNFFELQDNGNGNLQVITRTSLQEPGNPNRVSLWNVSLFS